MVEMNRRSMLSLLLLGLFVTVSLVVFISAQNLSEIAREMSKSTAQSGASDLPAIWETTTRSIMYLGASAAIGSILFAALIWRPAFRAWSARHIGADQEATQVFQQIVLIGLAMLAITTIVDGALHRTLLPASEIEGGAIRTALLWGRIVLLGFMAFLTVKLPNAATGSFRLWGVMLGLAALLVLTFSIQSHAAASGMALPVLANYLHVSAASAWIGGLMPLGVLLTLARRRGAEQRHSVPMRILIPRFSLLAITCVTLLTLTGLFSTSLLVRSPEALLTTGYGRSLLAKTGMVAILMALGAVNLMFLSPKLRTSEFKASSHLLQVVRTELVIGLMVLIATGLIAGAVPAYKTYRSAYTFNLTQEAEVADVGIRLSADPYPLIMNDRVFVDIIDPRPGESASEVLVQFGSSEPIKLDASSDGKYSLRGAYLKAFGPWKVTVIVQRAGYSDVQQQFELRD